MGATHTVVDRNAQIDRQTTLGGLILVFGFLWSDLVCYALGVELGVLIEIIGGIVPGEERC